MSNMSLVISMTGSAWFSFGSSITGSRSERLTLSCVSSGISASRFSTGTAVSSSFSTSVCSITSAISSCAADCILSKFSDTSNCLSKAKTSSVFSDVEWSISSIISISSGFAEFCSFLSKSAAVDNICSSFSSETIELAISDNWLSTSTGSGVTSTTGSGAGWGSGSGAVSGTASTTGSGTGAVSGTASTTGSGAGWGSGCPIFKMLSAFSVSSEISSVVMLSVFCVDKVSPPKSNTFSVAKLFCAGSGSEKELSSDAESSFPITNSVFKPPLSPELSPEPAGWAGCGDGSEKVLSDEMVLSGFFSSFIVSWDSVKSRESVHSGSSSVGVPREILFRFDICYRPLYMNWFRTHTVITIIQQNGVKYNI